MPSALYSLSYEPNTDWSRVLPTNAEIERYLLKVAKKYDLLTKMSFSTDVKECQWDADRCRWRILVRDLANGLDLIHECTILFSAAGQLVYPRDLGIPGQETFSGDIFHSARWHRQVTLDDKDVVVIGNGCTATQIVPSIVSRVKSLTQVVRSKHWVFPPIDQPYPSWLRWVFRNVPFALRLHRLQIFLMAEREFPTFPNTPAAAALRAKRRVAVERYMRQTAPAKYHDLLIPDFEVGCKRRIFDTGYLASLHAPKVTLTDAKILSIVPEGLQTTDGIIKADIIILANGFKTNEFISPMVVKGVENETLTEHWAKAGGPEAYNCSVLHGFPNFFMLLGPNAATGHTSAVMASENMVNYALRVAAPVLQGLASTVEIHNSAEQEYSRNVQSALQNTVWNTGCQSWYVKKDDETGAPWNAMSYPWSQAHFWYRSLFPIWQDWKIAVTRSHPCSAIETNKRFKGRTSHSYHQIVPPLMLLAVCALLHSSVLPIIS